MTAPSNPFKPDDKVLTKVKGDVVETTVRLVWNNEVQVRTSDGALLWRTAKTVRPLAVAGSEQQSSAVLPATAESAPASGDAEPTALGRSPTEPVSPKKELEPANAIDAPFPASEQAESVTEPLPEANSELELPSRVPAPTNFGGCGTADEIVKQKKRRRRR